jgi:opacity protein-like surface antigen
MNQSRNIIVFVGAALVVLGLAQPAAAQRMTKGEFSAGYQLLTLSSEGESETFSKGWYVDVVGNLTEMIGIVGEVGGSYKSITETLGTATATADFKIHEFMGGIRATSRTSPAVAPFGQVLFGIMNGSFGVSASAPGQSFSTSDSGSNFAMQLGGGVNIGLTEKVGIRVGADYIRIFEEGGGANAFRVVAGVNIPF